MKLSSVPRIMLETTEASTCVVLLDSPVTTPITIPDVNESASAATITISTSRLSLSTRRYCPIFGFFIVSPF